MFSSKCTFLDCNVDGPVTPFIDLFLGVILRGDRHHIYHSILLCSETENVSQPRVNRAILGFAASAGFFTGLHQTLTGENENVFAVVLCLLRGPFGCYVIQRPIRGDHTTVVKQPLGSLRYYKEPARL